MKEGKKPENKITDEASESLFNLTLLNQKISWSLERWPLCNYLFLQSVQFSCQSCPTLCDHKYWARQAPLSITNSRSLLKLVSIESVMPSNDHILCCPLLLLPSVFPSIRVFSDESVLRIRWPTYCSFSFSINPSSTQNTQDWFPLGWTGWISLQSKGLSRVFSNTTVQKHQFFGTQLSL